MNNNKRNISIPSQIIPLLPPEQLFPIIAHLYRTSEQIFTLHAKQRMNERTITEKQIEYICTNSSVIIGDPRFNNGFKEWAYRISHKGVSVVIILDRTRKIKVITVMYNNDKDIDNNW
jgi:hypothetical protein